MKNKSLLFIILLAVFVVSAAVLFIWRPWKDAAQKDEEQTDSVTATVSSAPNDMEDEIIYDDSVGDPSLSDEETALIEDAIIGNSVNIVDPTNELTNMIGLTKVIYLKEMMYYMVRDEAALRDQKSFTVKPGTVQADGTTITFTLESETNPEAQVEWVYETTKDRLRYRIVGITEEDAGVIPLGDIETLEIYYPDSSDLVTITLFEKKMTIDYEDGRSETRENLEDDYINGILEALYKLSWEEYKGESRVAVYGENGKLSPINAGSYEKIFEQVVKGLQ